MFLHGELEEEIYMLQQKGFEENGKKELGFQVNQIMHSLKQTLKCWYKRFDSLILSLRYNRLNSNHCIYYKRFDGDDFIILLLYVDDMLVVSLNKD